MEMMPSFSRDDWPWVAAGVALGLTAALAVASESAYARTLPWTVLGGLSIGLLVGVCAARLRGWRRDDFAARVVVYACGLCALGIIVVAGNSLKFEINVPWRIVFAVLPGLALALAWMFGRQEFARRGLQPTRRDDATIAALAVIAAGWTVVVLLLARTAAA